MTRHTTQIDVISTAYLDEGQGIPIIAVHGIPTSSTLFKPLFPYLRGCRLIAPDLLGQGHTEIPAAGRLGFAAYERHFRKFMEVVAPPQFNLLVHDFGGVLGLTWLLEHPERVQRLIILSTTAVWTWRWELAVRFISLGNLLLGTRFIRWGFQTSLRRPNNLPPEELDEWVAPWGRRRMLRGVDHFEKIHLDRVSARLNEITIPTLILWGRQDNIFPLSHADLIQKQLPHAEFITIADCGHWSPVDAPQVVGDHIARFVAR